MPKSASALSIVDVRCALLRLPYVEQPGFMAGYDRDREILTIEIETQDGLVGLGYQLYLNAGFRTTKACLEEIMIPRIIGRDATEIEAIWRDLWRATVADGRGGAQLLALSAIDVALWDLVGQRAQLPLHRLWGHFRNHVPVYGSGCFRGSGGDGMVAKAKRFVDAGYKAVKMQVGHIWTDAEDIANVRRVRDAVGPNIDIMVDVNMAWTADKAILMGRKLAEFDIYWLEEPVLPDDFHGYQRIAKALDLRVVGGESHFTRYDLRPFFEDPQLPILQPDVIRGGLTDMRKTAAIADTWGMTIAPHLYPELMIHVLASIPNGLIIEDMGLLEDIWVSAPKVINGMMEAPEAPGHGLQIKPEIMRDARVG
jgi:L-alanine-DL-glutamate epimerase-like enolase superfamily enzyme